VIAPLKISMTGTAEEHKDPVATSPASSRMKRMPSPMLSRRTQPEVPEGGGDTVAPLATSTKDGQAATLTAAALRRTMPGPPTDAKKSAPVYPEDNPFAQLQPSATAPPAYSPQTPVKPGGGAVFTSTPGVISPAQPKRPIGPAASNSGSQSSYSDSEIQRTAGESYHSDGADMSETGESMGSMASSSGRDLTGTMSDDSRIATGTRTQTRTMSQSFPDDKSQSGSASGGSDGGSASAKR
jgi:hypothetical protein